MPVYRYKARDKFGKAISGIMAGDSGDTVTARLKQMGYTPVNIEEARRELLLSNLFQRFGRVSSSDLNMFCRQFATLQKAGLPILLSLGALREQALNITLRKTIAQVIRDVEAGSSLSSALGRHPRIFNAIYVNMIKSGEASGTLDQVLGRLATLGEHEEKAALRIKAATRYPVIVITAIIFAFFVLIALVVPRFSRLYSQFTTALPLPTRVLLGINSAITNFWWLGLIIIAALISGFNAFVNTKGGRLWLDNLKLRMPVFGPLVLKLTMSRFTRLMGTLLRSGISILEVLDLTQEGAGNAVLTRTIEKIKTSVSEGKGLTEPIKASGIFPPVVIQMIMVGEESGKIDELLLHVSDYYDSQVDYMINNLIVLIEPLLIAVLGGIVLFMALGIFLPVWNMIRLYR